MGAEAGKVYIGVAANFTAVAKQIAAAFEEEAGHKAILSFGSTGKLYIQIKNGAPFSVFLSADSNRPERLEAEGDIVAGSRFTYAQGKMVLYSRDAGLIEAGSPDVLLRDEAFSKLAIANPKTAPYGMAAVQALKKLSAYEGVTTKSVKGDNIAQTYQFVFTQNAQLGIVAQSQVIDVTEGSRWVVPDDHYDPINQQAVLLKKGQDNIAARAFMTFLKGDKAQLLIQRYGYGVVK